jgi:hypothetical protein
MNLKKTLIMLYCLGLFPLSCIREGQKLKYFTIAKSKLEVYQDKQHLILRNEADTIKSDSIFLRFNFTPTFLASTNINLGWQNECFANKLLPPGYLGLKTKLVSIKLFSNATFNGITAGSNLAEKVHYSINGKIKSESGLQSMVDYLNGSGNHQYDYNDIGFCFTQKASEIKKHTFTLELQDLAGEITRAGIDLVWE